MTRAIPIDRYRTIGILASQDAGRTTTTERILAVAAPGETVPAGQDERAITQTSAATSCDWNGCRLTIVELPGIGRPLDEAVLASVDAVVFVLDAERGVTPDVEAALAHIASLGLPRLVFVNKLDRADADLAALARGIPCGALLQLPIGAGAGLIGLVDLVALNGVFWREPRVDAPSEAGPIPQDMIAGAEAARAQLVATTGGSADKTGLADGIRRAVRAGTLVPVLGGSAFRNRGTRRLLDAIVDYLPAPSDIERTAVAASGETVTRPASDDEPFAGLVFRTVNDPAAGRLTFVRVQSGVIATGRIVLNAASRRQEQIGAMVRVHASHTEAVEEARAGDIVALVGLQHTTSGDTLCDPAAPVVLGGYRPRSAA
jgi:elongation factor G